MIATLISCNRPQTALIGSLRRLRPSLTLFTLLILFPALALAQSPFDTGFTAMQTLFTGTVAKVASLIASDPAGAIDELKTQFAGSRMKKLLRAQIQNSVAVLEQRVQAFTRQLGDFIEIKVLSQPEQFTFFRRLLNYDDWRIAGKPQSTQFLDYQVVNSTSHARKRVMARQVTDNRTMRSPFFRRSSNRRS